MLKVGLRQSSRALVNSQCALKPFVRHNAVLCYSTASQQGISRARVQEAMCAEEAGAAPAQPLIHARHFARALTALRPSVSPRDARMYARLRDKLQAVRTGAGGGGGGNAAGGAVDGSSGADGARAGGAGAAEGGASGAGAGGGAEPMDGDGVFGGDVTPVPAF